MREETQMGVMSGGQQVRLDTPNYGGDISDYIANNEIPLSTENYNELDGLVFSQLSYMSFERIEWNDDDISVKEFAESILENKEDFELSDDDVRFLESLQDCRRYDDCIIDDMAALDGTDYWHNGETKTQTEDGQWGALTIKTKKEEDTSFIAFRGTNGTKLGWDEDFELGFTIKGTTAQQMSKEYLSESEAEYLFLAGHSKGGNDAVSAFLMSVKQIRDKVVRIDNYDGPSNNMGFFSNYIEGLPELETVLHNHYPKNSIIGMILGYPVGTRDFCDTDTYGHRFFGPLAEHDPYSWKIVNMGSLGGSKQSELSKTIVELMDGAFGDFNAFEKFYYSTLLGRLGLTTWLDGNKSLAEKMLFTVLGIDIVINSPIDRWIVGSLLRKFTGKIIYLAASGQNSPHGALELNVKWQPVNITGNSDSLNAYKDCYKKLQKVVEAYSVLLVNDGARIKSAKDALKQEDRMIMK